MMKGADLEQISTRQEEILREIAAEQRKFAEYKQKNKLEYFTKPNPPQKKLLEAWADPSYKVFTFTGGNRSGKTTIGVILAFSTMFGKYLWDDEPVPGLDLRKPRKVRYVGQGWETHIKAVIEPALAEWWPVNRPKETRKNNQGVDYVWKDLLTGSTLEIMSNSQDSSVFEGWQGDLIVYDEPPSRDVRVASARGLIDRRGRELFCATLLKEAWVHREVIKAVTSDGRADLSVYNVHADIQDNVGFGLTQEGVDQFEKTLKAEEKEARLRGKPSYMSTLVCPRFNRQINVRERFKVPFDWITDISIDFHPSKPWAVSFLSTARNNLKYLTFEIKMHGNPESVVDEILRISKNNTLRLGRVGIDPLAKGGEDNQIDVFSKMSDRFASHGIVLETASKDKEVGISILNSLLWTENEMPGLFFFSDCINTIQQVEDWMYDPDTFKPSKVEDDFCECLYRLCLQNTEWFDESTVNMEKQPDILL